MDTIEQLRIKCRKEMTPEQRKERPWFTEEVTRRLSIYLSWACIRLGMSANQVSLLVVILGILAGGACIGGHFLLGVLLLQSWYLIDAVDGEIARYHGVNDLTGDYTDKLMHYVIEAWVFYALGSGLAERFEVVWIHSLGLWVAFFFTLLKLLYDLKYKCLVLHAQSVLGEVAFRKQDVTQLLSPRHHWLQRSLKTYSLYPNVMNILTGAALLDVAGERVYGVQFPWSCLVVVLLSYALFYPAACLKGVYGIIRERGIDRECEEMLIFKNS